jgi:hypothetical protein
VKKFKYNILGEYWEIQLLKPESYIALHGDDSLAITDIDDKIVYFRTDELHYKNIVHEINHTYLESQIKERKLPEETDAEEFFCNFNGKYAKQIVEDTLEIFGMLGGKISDDRSFYKKI